MRSGMRWWTNPTRISPSFEEVVRAAQVDLRRSIGLGGVAVPGIEDVVRLLSAMSQPGLSRSPWMRGVPQAGFSRHTVRIISRGVAGNATSSHHATHLPGPKRAKLGTMPGRGSRREFSWTVQHTDFVPQRQVLVFEAGRSSERAKAE